MIYLPADVWLWQCHLLSFLVSPERNPLTIDSDITKNDVTCMNTSMHEFGLMKIESKKNRSVEQVGQVTASRLNQIYGRGDICHCRR